MRDFWKGDVSPKGLAPRLCASSDAFNRRGRKPWASVNFLTAHDGFTLNDVVSYNEKHNEANGEGNRDGTDSNRSWNHGAEGPTDDDAICELRNRQMRNMMATLLLSQGTPMILAGDIGGTKTNLALFEADGDKLRPVREATFPRRDHAADSRPRGEDR